MNVPVVRASADLRLLRAAVFTAACVALSAAAHTVGGGTAVPLWTLGLAALVTFALAAPLAGRERTLPGIAAGLALGQLALHGLFAAGQTLSVRAPAGAGEDRRIIELARALLCNDQLAGSLTVAHARRSLSEAGLGHLAGTASHGAHASHGPADPAVSDAAAPALNAVLAVATSPMLLAHLAAAVVTGVLLRRGEAALWRLVRLSALAVDELLLRALRDVLHWLRTLGAGLAGSCRPVRPAAAVGPPVPVETEALRHSLSRRGPPSDARDFALTA
ncbi:hypothetical protein MTQ01_01430 [Streptomyces sp. XM4193]|uniref:hypothetical protein n=1 Tax=Streptomyces sp. XM4193 TaxID=2929782 RepID=UPI001FFA123C|nr:hypothetical protein [Streptomyces sp. XM4193]MCK1794709.1 hypothetical protein [Streptomyces sp. XM4193]